MKRWVLDQNSNNTCAFVTVPMIPFDKNGVLIIKAMTQTIFDINFKIQRMNGELTPPHFHSWGVRSTGHEEGTKFRPKTGLWAEMLLVRGSGSAVLRDPKVICQVKACLKYFPIMYKLDRPMVTPTQANKTVEEKRQLQNQDRIRRRRRQEARKLEEDNERLRLAEERGFARSVEAVCKQAGLM